MKLLDRIFLGLIVGRIKKRIGKDSTMAAIINILKGKKTHVIAVVALILGILQGFDIFTVEAEWWPVIGALGLSSLRAGVKSTAEQIRKETK